MVIRMKISPWQIDNINRQMASVCEIILANVPRVYLWNGSLLTPILIMRPRKQYLYSLLFTAAFYRMPFTAILQNGAEALQTHLEPCFCALICHFLSHQNLQSHFQNLVVPRNTLYDQNAVCGYSVPSPHVLYGIFNLESIWLLNKSLGTTAT